MADMTHILMIPPGYPKPSEVGGGAIFFAEQAEIMRRIGGWTCHVLSPTIAPATKIKTNPTGISVQKLPDGGEVWRDVFPYRFPLNRVSAWKKFGAQMFSAYVEKHGIPDLIWAQQFSGPGWLAQEVRQRWGVPYFVHVHGSRYYHKRRISFRWRMSSRRIIRGAVYCAAVSELHRQAIVRQLGIPAQSLEVIHNPVGLSFIEPPNRAERTGRGFTFVCVARLSWEKNQASLLHAFARFRREEDRQARLRLIGDGPDRQKLTDLTQALQITDAVELTGPLGRDEVREALLTADAFILPSFIESFGVALMEALCYGLPCVVTPCGSAPEVIDDTTGILLSDGRVDTILAGMKKLRRTTYDSSAIRRRNLEISSPECFCDTLYGLLTAHGFAVGNRSGTPVSYVSS